MVIFCIAVSSGSNGGGNCVTGERGCDDNPKTKKKSHIHGGRGGLRYENECCVDLKCCSSIG